MRRRLAFLGVARLAPDRLEQVPVHRERCEPETLQLVRLGEARDVEKYVLDVGADFRIAR